MPAPESSSGPEPSAAGGGDWKVASRNRFDLGIEEMTKRLRTLEASDADINRTRWLITDFMCEALGHDPTALTSEYLVQGQFAAFGIRIDEEIAALVQPRPVGTALAAKDLWQVQMHAVTEGVKWLVLTGGGQWQLYHAEAGPPERIEMLFDVDLDGQPLETAEQLLYLSREWLEHRELDKLWNARSTSPTGSAGLLASEALATEIRKERLRKLGDNVDLVRDLRPRQAAELGPGDREVAPEQELAGQAAKLSLAAVSTAGEAVLPPIVKAFRQRYPPVEISVTVGNRAWVLERIVYRKADLGFGGRPPPNTGILGEAFLDNHLVVVAAAGHPLASEPVVDPASLAKQTWLLREPGSGTRRATEDFLFENDLEPASVITLGSSGAVKQGAVVGLGITLISAHAVASEVAEGALVFLRVPGTPLRRAWHVHYLDQVSPPATALAFLEFLRSPACRQAVDEWFAPSQRLLGSMPGGL